jgi:hypothetical protein
MMTMPNHESWPLYGANALYPLGVTVKDGIATWVEAEQPQIIPAWFRGYATMAHLTPDIQKWILNQIEDANIYGEYIQSLRK